MTVRYSGDLIWSCPDCDGDLEPDSGGGYCYCPDCQRTVSYAQLTGVTDADLD
jgi:hypothetical protein